MNPQNINISEYDYPLPDEQIAKHPLEQRDACRLMMSRDGKCTDEVFYNLPELLPADTMLVCNNTRVINARLRFSKSTGAAIEIFCLEPKSPANYEQAFASRRQCSWQCLVGNSKKWKEGALEMHIVSPVGECTLVAERAPEPLAADRSQTIIFRWDNPAFSFSDIISAVGEIPIPPYLNRKSEATDTQDYQTVYSHIEGSVAAPTAGLHFTPELLDKLAAKGVQKRELTLHVGAGTFRPVKSDTIGEHDMHSETIAVPLSFIEELADTVGVNPVAAVGTTSMRTLESLYHIGCAIMRGEWDGELPQWAPYAPDAIEPSAREALMAIAGYLRAEGSDLLTARTRIMIAPSYRFRIVDILVTNFHQPQSTLLLLVSAFIGEEWRELYSHALGSGYRFLSYGDACLFFRKK